MNKYVLSTLAALALPSAAMAGGFVNGDFETGNANGWQQAGIDRSPYFNNQLNTSLFTVGVDTGRSAAINNAYVDPNLGAKLGTTVYAGNYSYRVENTVAGGYASLLQQQVNNYTDANIFFAWKSVLLGAHGINDAATMIISLRDLTTNTELIRREYNAASGGGGVDPRFTLDAATGAFYTKDWQIEQLAIGAGLQGHNFLLSIIAADCEPTAHYGYVYIDGFGAVTPPSGAVPESSTWSMMIAGFGLAGAALRYRRRKTAVSFG
jgi:PEP-CTERM motif